MFPFLCMQCANYICLLSAAVLTLVQKQRSLGSKIMYKQKVMQTEEYSKKRKKKTTALPKW